MKKIIFASVALLMAATGIRANTGNAISKNDKPSREERKEIRKEKKAEKSMFKKPEEVSYQSKQEFYRKFGNIPGVVWTRSKNFDEVVFNNNGVSTTAFYDVNSDLVGATNFVSFADLPEAGQKQILKEYKDYTVKEIVFFDDNENNDTNMVLYNSQFDGEDNYFVELQKDDKTIVVQVTPDGLTGYFTSL